MALDDYILPGALYCNLLSPPRDWNEVMEDLVSMGVTDTVSVDSPPTLTGPSWFYVRGRWGGRIFEGRIPGHTHGMWHSDMIRSYLKDRKICSDPDRTPHDD